jgi:predicted ATPase
VSTLRGWATVEQGRDEEGIAQMQESLAAYRATGTSLNRPYLLILVAEACRETGGPHGLNALTEALAAADEHENRVWEAEIHRLKGELLLKQNDSNTAEAQGCFQRAIQIASRQAAKSLELRGNESRAATRQAGPSR